MTTEEAIKVMHYCATHEPAHYGGSHGMFVDISVEALAAALNGIDAMRDALEALVDCTPGDEGAIIELKAKARAALELESE